MSAISLGPLAGLRAALLLAGGRPDVALLVGAEPPDAQLARARHSFAALLLCLPVFITVQALARDAPGLATLRELASFLLAWLGYAVLSQRLATEMGRAALWPRFIVLWNWTNLVQYLLLAAALVPQLLGLHPLLAQTAWLAALGWALWLQWTATRLGLALSGGRAALMVIVDIALGLVVLRLTAG